MIYFNKKNVFFLVQTSNSFKFNMGIINGQIFKGQKHWWSSFEWGFVKNVGIYNKICLFWSFASSELLDIFLQTLSSIIRETLSEAAIFSLAKFQKAIFFAEASLDGNMLCLWLGLFSKPICDVSVSRSFCVWQGLGARFCTGRHKGDLQTYC